mmetsp:Transcript_44057/g.104251  ORF Transcript_44057/g.104251 Transcript_44057/m.104251 type:complete len:84 (+) Transcript_44057:135-386(+)
MNCIALRAAPAKDLTILYGQPGGHDGKAATRWGAWQKTLKLLPRFSDDHASNTLYGFKIPFGSRVAFKVLMRSIAAGALLKCK